MRFLRFVVAGAIILFAAANARGEDIAAAKMHYERGTTLFDLQRYTEAAKEYEAAFEAKNDPALLFNIGQAYRFAADYPKAIAAYRSYLRRLPDAENRADVQQRIAELQKLMDEQKKSAAPATTSKSAEPEAPMQAATPTPAPIVGVSEKAPPQNPGRAKLVAGIVIAAAGVAGVVVGGVFEGLAKSENDALSKPPAGATFDPSKESALKTDEAAGATLLAVGGAAIVAGVVVAIVGLRERSRAHASVSPALAPHFAGMAIDARF